MARAAALALAFGAAALLLGCATDDQKRAAINEVNEEFRIEYERILAEQGTRIYRANVDEAFVAMRSALARLGMQLGDQSPRIGYLNVFAAAPKPLSAEEWRGAAGKDLPKLRAILEKHIGFLAWFVPFEPDGLEIVINVTTLEVKSGAELSLTMRMRELAPPKSGMPRREYAPPTAVRMGLDKIWSEFERELRSVRSRTS
jgi:hypothetical protein